MKISEILHESEQLDEIAGGLISIANWFGKKYHDVLKTGSTKIGQGEIQRFTNQHMRTFMRAMGRFRQDWDTVTMRTVYQYLRLTLKLPESDILTVVNEVMLDPTVRGKKLSLNQIQDAKNKLVVGSIGNIANDPTKAQVVVEKLIAAAAVKAVENHWENSAGVKSKEQPGTTERPRVRPKAVPGPTSTSTTSSTKYTPPDVSSLTNVKIGPIYSGIKQLRALA